MTKQEFDNAKLDIRHSEPHSPVNPCSPSCEGYVAYQRIWKDRKRTVRANIAARGRYDAMRSLGLKRTSYGNWE